MFKLKDAGKLLLPIAGLVLTVASGIVNNKNQEAKLEETVAKKVAEALADKAKGES